MFSHAMLSMDDLGALKKFYDTLLGTLGIDLRVLNKAYCFYRSPPGLLSITMLVNGESAIHGNGLTIGFNEQSPESADAFHAAGMARGGTTCEDRSIGLAGW